MLLTSKTENILIEIFNSNIHYKPVKIIQNIGIIDITSQNCDVGTHAIVNIVNYVIGKSFGSSQKNIHF